MDALTDTCTTTTAVRGASTGAGRSVTTCAIHHANPAARPDLATTPISDGVGGVHETSVDNALPQPPDTTDFTTGGLRLHRPALLQSRHVSGRGADGAEWDEVGPTIPGHHDEW